MKKNGAQLLARLLYNQGIDTVFGIPGGNILPVYDALTGAGLRHITARHEQGAGFMAQGYARKTGKTGVVLVTSGPGIANLITALSDAYSDSVPMLAVAGQVPLNLLGSDAFQEVDTPALTAPVCKGCFTVTSAAGLQEILPEALHLSQTGRPGPVVLNFPKDIQLQTAEETETIFFSPQQATLSVSSSELQLAASMLEQAQNPVIYAGTGARQAADLILDLAEKTGIPVVTTLTAKGLIPTQSRHSGGIAGIHGNSRANKLLCGADILLICGARLNDRATGLSDTFQRIPQIIRIDITPADQPLTSHRELFLEGDCRRVLQLLLPQIKPSDTDIRSARMQKTHAIPFDRFEPATAELNPQAVLEFIGNRMPEDTVCTTDVGQHQIWAAQYFPVSSAGNWMTSGGQGTMGFGLPAAIGAALSAPEKPVLCITGDGSLQMNLQELSTLSELQLPVKIILFNNRQLGLVAQQQELHFSGNIAHSRFSFSPDWEKICAGFSIFGKQVTSLNGIGELLGRPGPVLIEIPASRDWLALPVHRNGFPLDCQYTYREHALER